MAATKTLHARMKRETYLIDALGQLEALVKAAEAEGSYGPAVQAKSRAILVRAELDQLRETTAKATAAPATVDAHKAEVLQEVRRLRIGATAAGSYVAAATLLRAEREIIALDEAEGTASREKRDKAATLAELQEELAGLVASLPQ